MQQPPYPPPNSPYAERGPSPGGQPTWAQGPQGPYQDPALKYVAPVNVAPLALVAGYVGLASMLCLPSPIALALGIAALADLKKNPGRDGAGRAWFAIVTGGIGTLLLLFAFVGRLFN